MGFSRGSIAGILKGSIPAGENLATIARVTNCSLNWLLTGEAAPYRVSTFADGDDAADYVTALADETWAMKTLAHHNADQTLVMIVEMPGQYEVNGKPFDYRIMEVISAPINDALMQACIALPSAQEQVVMNGASDLHKLALGWLSPHDFMIEHKPAALVAEPQALYRIGQENPGMVLARRISKLSPAAQSRMMGYLDALDDKLE